MQIISGLKLARYYLLTTLDRNLIQAMVLKTLQYSLQMDPITKKSFKSLTKTEQVVMVIKSGKELLTRHNEDYFVKLFLLSDVFIEIHYETNRSTIVKIETPSSEMLINNYNIEKKYLDELIHQKV